MRKEEIKREALYMNPCTGSIDTMAGWSSDYATRAKEESSVSRDEWLSGLVPVCVSGWSERGRDRVEALLKRAVKPSMLAHLEAWLAESLEEIADKVDAGGASFEVGATYSQTGTPITIDVGLSDLTFTEVK